MTLKDFGNLLLACKGAQVGAIMIHLNLNYTPSEIRSVGRAIQSPTDATEDVARALRNYMLIGERLGEEDGK